MGFTRILVRATQHLTGRVCYDGDRPTRRSRLLQLTRLQQVRGTAKSGPKNSASCLVEARQGNLDVLVSKSVRLHTHTHNTITPCTQARTAEGEVLINSVVVLASSRCTCAGAGCDSCGTTVRLTVLLYPYSTNFCQKLSPFRKGPRIYG